MSVESPRPLRADAARAAERIVRAARRVYATSGPDAPLEEMARLAGVGTRTLYRRFPTKRDLTRAALDQVLAEEIAPVVERALDGTDSLASLRAVIEAAVTVAGREYHLLAALQSAGALTPDIYTPFHGALGELIARAQREGVVRPDLHPDDLPRIMVMLISVLMTMDRDSDDWQRYLALMMDALSPDGAHPLPAAAPRLRPGPRRDWPARPAR